MIAGAVMKLTREQCLAELQRILDQQFVGRFGFGDVEDLHRRADQVLLEFIDDAEIIEVYRAIPKWYA